MKRSYFQDGPADRYSLGAYSEGAMAGGIRAAEQVLKAGWLSRTLVAFGLPR